MASTSTTPTTEDLCTRWTHISDDELTLDDIEQCLYPTTDDLWVTAACHDRILEDPALERALLELGIKRTEAAIDRSRKAFEHILFIGDDEDGVAGSSTLTEEQRRHASLISHYRQEPAHAQLCLMRTALFDRLDRLNTFLEIYDTLPEKEKEKTDSVDDEWEDDPWAEGADEPSRIPAASASVSKESPVSLSTFLTYSLLDLSFILASLGHFNALRILTERHCSFLWPYRFSILDSIPEHIPASEYRAILPALDTSTDIEQKPESNPWRPELDWSERTEVVHILHEFLVLHGLAPSTETVNDVPSAPEPLTSGSLSTWYRERVEKILDSSGMVDVALSLVQHAASQGVAGLDEIGEELSLLSRLVYDVSVSGGSEGEDWTFGKWKALEPASAVRAYLAYSTPDTVVRDINKLVMPYLFVLESRAERADHPDPSLPNRLLYDYILSAPLDIVAAIFEASKPILPPAQRLLRDDEDMARLALACLYGSDSLDEWPIMSRIFECLPAWDAPEDEDADEADTTIASLGTFVTPSTTRLRCTPTDLLLFFQPLPSSSLSRALDILDVHLESGEILSRWSVPAPLRWFLQSNGDIAEQRSWANRMARRAGGSEDQLESQEDWEWLLEDMLKLSGDGDSGLKGALCLLSRDDVARIFFSGLLSSGRFDIAKNMLREDSVQINTSVVEDICLTCSQEFYDNANSGNYHFGEMKLAYECLDVPLPSDRVIKEKEFIEATSRLCSFNLMSRPGIPISPIEIRLTKNRLSLVSRVLSSNPDAYKHTQVALELVHMLGFRGDIVAEVKTLAMLTDTALQAEDFDRAFDTSERMVQTVLDLRSSSRSQLEDPKVQKASEVCWVACFQLGRQTEFQEVQKKLTLLGRALELCPPDKLIDVLTAWRKLDQENLEERRLRLTARRSGTVRVHEPLKRPSKAQVTTASLTSRLQHLHMPDLHMPSSPLVSAPDAAALANKAFSRVAANFSFGVGGRGRSLMSEERDRSRSSERSSSTRFDGTEVSAQATKALQKGLGWLLGEDD